jgi:hypothetical protein
MLEASSLNRPSHFAAARREFINFIKQKAREMYTCINKQLVEKSLKTRQAQSETDGESKTLYVVA